MSTFTDSYKVPELRKKMWFTFLILSVLALLSLVPVPGIDHAPLTCADQNQIHCMHSCVVLFTKQ